MGNYNNNILGHNNTEELPLILKGLGVKTLFSFGYTKKK